MFAIFQTAITFFAPEKGIQAHAMLTTMLRSTSNRVSPLVRSLSIRTLSSAGSKQEITTLREEIRSLQTLLAQHNRQYEVLSKQMQAQSTHMGTTIENIHEKVALLSSPLERISAGASVFVHNTEALLEFVNRFERYSRGWINKYSISAILLVILTSWSYRTTMYDRTSEEVAEIASRTLRQEGLQQTIQETLDALANSPETLKTLNDLLQKVLRDPLTLQELITLVGNALETPEVQKSLLSLLEVVLADPALQQQAGEFLLKGLDIESVKDMLEAQTQSLVREVVLDSSVQQATAVGVKQSLWYLATPVILWPRSKHDVSLDSTREGNPQEGNPQVEGESDLSA